MSHSRVLLAVALAVTAAGQVLAEAEVTVTEGLTANAASTILVDADVETDVSHQLDVDQAATAPEQTATSEGVCEKEPCDDSEACAEETVCETAPSDEAAAHASNVTDEVTEFDEEDRVYPTHHQTRVIAVNTDSLAATSLHSFCVSPSGELLAACDGEIRVFTGDGDYITTWELPVTPEAINVGSDGTVYIGGESKLLRLTADGKVMSQVRSPLADSLLEQRDRIREEVIEQAKRSTEVYGEMRDQYAKQVTELEEKQLAAERSEEASANGEESDLTVDSESPPEPFTAAHDQQLRMARQMVDQMDQIIEQMGGADEMTDEEIEQRVDAAMQYKLKVASICEADGEVFLATSAPTGHGYAVWRMSRHFDSPKMIAKDLRGCCGQMDVQVNSEGVFVAENSRDRVCRFSREGELICQWGHSARSGLEGFGSCCNPMNVNFGPEGSVYTAESGTGRIKRYTSEGKLLELVGKVDLVPGCKKVAIAATPDGDRLYMLDITRNHIVMMKRFPVGETSDYFEVRSENRGSSLSRSLGAFFEVFSRATDAK